MSTAKCRRALDAAYARLDAQLQSEGGNGPAQSRVPHRAAMVAERITEKGHHAASISTRYFSPAASNSP